MDPYRIQLGNLPEIIKSTILGNEQQLPFARSLSKKIDNFNQASINRLLQKALPGVRQMVEQASNNTLSMLRGEIPADVAAASRRKTANAALQGGFSGSESADALTARDLGTTSLNLMQEGSNSAQRWIQTARQYLMPALTDPTTMLATPQLTISSILGAAGIAKDQSEIVTSTAAREAQILLGATSAATGAQLDGAAAGIAGDRQAGESIGKGVQGLFGSFAGSLSGGGSTPAVGSTNQFGGIYTGQYNGLPVYRPGTA